MNKSAVSWNKLHIKKQFRPKYPSESVIRFMNSCFPTDLKKRNKTNILDIGCGGGRHLKLFKENEFNVYGGDYSKIGVEETKKFLDEYNLTAELKVFDMWNLPWENEYFDGAISYGVYYYSNQEGMRSSINEMFRVLKKGGKGFINLRSTDDYRCNKGEQMENNTFKLTIHDTNEFGMIMHFLSIDNVYEYFSLFQEIHVEKNELSSISYNSCHSDWLITVVK